MKNIIFASLLLTAASASAQDFVAGWDFSGVGLNDTTDNANWGDLEGSANLSWSHATADFVTTYSNEFGISAGFNSAAVNNSFVGTLTGDKDANTGYASFSQNTTNGSTGGFQALSTDEFTFSFNATGYTDLELLYAYNPDGETGTFSLMSVDLSSLDGLANAEYSFNTVIGGAYDNFMITGTAAVPEPSTYAAIFGAVALAFVGFRRRK
ncbi:PEP-CTERM sorting domain-containing protein [Coraliomargarita sp. W4R53]